MDQSSLFRGPACVRCCRVLAGWLQTVYYYYVGSDDVGRQASSVPGLPNSWKRELSTGFWQIFAGVRPRRTCWASDARSNLSFARNRDFLVFDPMYGLLFTMYMHFTACRVACLFLALTSYSSGSLRSHVHFFSTFDIWPSIGVWVDYVMSLSFVSWPFSGFDRCSRRPNLGCRVRAGGACGVEEPRTEVLGRRGETGTASWDAAPEKDQY